MTPRAWLGLGFVAACGVVITLAVAAAPGAATLGARLVDHLSGREDRLAMRFDERPDLRPGDPVYVVEAESLALVGRISRTTTTAPFRVEARIDPLIPRRLAEGTTAVAMNPNNDLGWVLRTLIPPDMRGRLLEEVRIIWDRERDTTLEILRPVLAETARDALAVLAETLPDVLRANEPHFREVGEIFASEVYPRELAPVIKEVWLPNLERRLARTAAETAVAAGKKLAFKNLAAVVWSGLKRKAGFGSEEELRRALQEVIEEAVLPALEEKAPELARGILAATLETLDDEEVREALLESASRFTEAPPFKELLARVSREWITRNPRLKECLQKALREERIVHLRRRLWTQFEPVMARALEEMLTRSAGEGMSLRLVRVLRRVVLNKDKRYVLLVPPGGLPASPHSPFSGGELAGRVGRDP